MPAVPLLRSWLPKGRSRALTLIELLIGVGLIAIVVSLLLPVIGATRQFSEATKCIHHLRQTGSAILAYAGERHGKVLPRYADDVPSHEAKGWPRRLVSLGYVNDPSILLCPSFTPKTLAESQRNPAITDASEAYGMRRWVTPSEAWSASGNKHQALATISEPSRFFLLADSIWLNWQSQGYGITAGSANQAVHLRHKDRANVLFLDGHVESKGADFFEKVSTEEIQYSGGRVLELLTVTNAELSARE